MPKIKVFYIVFLQEAETDLFKPEQMGGYFAEGWSYPGIVSFFQVSTPHRPGC